MTSKQLKKVAAQIEQTLNSRHQMRDMHVTAEAFIGTKKFAYINITPLQVDDKYCDTFYWPEDCPCQRAQSRARSSYAECSRAWA